ncbi:DUF2262 domain-containing protein [Bacillus cihuensis]|uniref:DUF2262 domain-containing protein n=1 Tax=Bacillus cihuensis TaxID=1208599 RepID=UPI00041AF770|nr:DUF2262 domain-containing protein [Bacillus cihuensis]
MISRLINYLSVRLSRVKKLDIDVNEYFPLTVHDFKEYKGIYTSKQDNFPFICLSENMKMIDFEGKNTILQNRTYINDEGSILFSDELVIGNSKGEVFEYSRYRNGKQTVHPVPMVYIDTYKKGLYPNNVFVFKSFETQFINDKETLCLLVTKKFYSGWRLQRIERLYLLMGVGMVKYEEESLYPYKFKLSYKISEENSGYRIINHAILGNLLYNPNSEQLSGMVQIASDHWVNLIISTEAGYKEDSILKVEGVLNDLIKMEHTLRHQIAEELLVVHNDEWSEGEVITSKEFAERIRLNTISLFDDGSIETYYDDGDLFWGHTILARLNKEFRLEHVDAIG